MKKNLLILLMCVSTAALLSGCKKCQGEPETIYGNGMTFYLVNKETQENLYPIANPSPDYKIDDVKILNEDLGKTTFEKIEENEVYGFHLENVYEESKIDIIAQTQEFCETYYLYLNEKDTDTLKICYKVSKSECGSRSFDHYKVFYNEKLNFEYNSFEEDPEIYFTNVKLEKENE